MTLTHAYILLGVAIFSEIVATGSLKATDGFTKLAPSLVSILSISLWMFIMSHIMKVLPIGINLCNLVWCWNSRFDFSGSFKYKEIPNIPTTIGLLLSVIGVVIVNTMKDN